MTEIAETPQARNGGGADRASSAIHGQLTAETGPVASPDRWAVLGGLRFFLATVVASGHIFGVMGPYDELTPLLAWMHQFDEYVAVLCFLPSAAIA